jgi:hypothetical protein
MTIITLSDYISNPKIYGKYYPWAVTHTILGKRYEKTGNLLNRGI